VLDFLLFAGLPGAPTARRSRRLLARIEAMLEYMASIMDMAGNVPMMAMRMMATWWLAAAPGCALPISMPPERYCSNVVISSQGRVADEKDALVVGEASAAAIRGNPDQDAVLPVGAPSPTAISYFSAGDFETPREVRLLSIRVRWVIVHSRHTATRTPCNPAVGRLRVLT